MKKNNLTKFTTLIFALFSMLVCHAQDNLSGKTIRFDLQKIIDAAAEGNSKNVELESGIYQLSTPLKLSEKHSGLTISSKSANADDVVISGGKKISNWKKESGAIWSAKIDGEDEVSFIIVNGKRANAANSGNLYVVPDAFNKHGNSFSMRDCDISEILKMSAQERSQVYADIYVGWSFFRVVISKIEKESEGVSRIHFAGPALNMRFGYYPRCIINNYYAALKNAGEFVFDKKTHTIFYIPREGEDMSKAEVVYPFLDTVLLACGRPEAPIENLTFSNVTFKYGSRRKHLDGSWGEFHQADPSCSGFIIFDNAKNLNIKNCKASSTDMYAFWLRKGVWDSSITQCEIHSVNGGVRIGEVSYGGGKRAQKILGVPEEKNGVDTGRILVENNIIYDYGTWAKSAIGIVVYDCHDIKLQCNDIFDGYYSGISCGFSFGRGATNSHDNKIFYNRISHLSYGHTSDLGGIYTLGWQKNSVMKGNSISDVSSHLYGGNGIYNDEGSSGWTITGNLVERVDGVAYSHAFGNEMRVENNLFISTGKCVYAFPHPERGKSSISFERNIVVYASPSIMWGYGSPREGETIFSKNIYWNENGETTFNKYSFLQWQGFGRDKDSFVEKPDVDAIKKGASVAKIGFKPLEALKAGTTGKMRVRADSLLANYKFPPVVKIDRKPPFDYGMYENFSVPTNGRPTVGKIAKIVKDGGVKALKLMPNPKQIVHFSGKLNIKNNSNVRCRFGVKLSPKSSFTFELYESGVSRSHKVKIVDAHFAFSEDEKIKLPQGQWLKVEVVSLLKKESPAKESRVKIFDEDGNLLVDETVKNWGQGFLSANRLSVDIPKGAESPLFSYFHVEPLKP